MSSSDTFELPDGRLQVFSKEIVEIVGTIRANNSGALMGRVMAVQAGGRHAVVRTDDGEHRGALIHPSMVPSSSTVVLSSGSGSGSNILEDGDEVLVLLRDCDSLRADIIYICPKNKTGVVVGESTESSSSSDGGKKGGSRKLGVVGGIGKVGDVNYEDEEDEEPDAAHIKTDVKVDPSFEPILCNKHHHHYLFRTIDRNVVDESDGVYCDSCDQLIKEKEPNLTCLVPYCFFDLCLSCSTGASSSEDNSATPKSKSKEPLFTIVSAVSDESNEDSVASASASAAGRVADGENEDDDEVWEDDEEDDDDLGDDDDDYYGKKFDEDFADIYGPKYLINTEVDYAGAKWTVRSISNRSNIDRGTGSAIPNIVPEPIGWVYSLIQGNGDNLLIESKVAEDEIA